MSSMSKEQLQSLCKCLAVDHGVLNVAVVRGESPFVVLGMPNGTLAERFDALLNLSIGFATVMEAAVRATAKDAGFDPDDAWREFGRTVLENKESPESTTMIKYSPKKEIDNG